jgi:DNA-binding response OmpR family regulator/heme-degrading monooxygenase HmoA
MIIRVFRGRVQPGKQDEYERLLVHSAIPEFRSQAGLIALHIGTPTERTPDEFLVTTVWKDLAALQAFAGDRWYEAKVGPDEEKLLKQVFVHHYEDRAGDRLPEAGRLGPPHSAQVLLVGGASQDLPAVIAALKQRRLAALMVPTVHNAVRLVEKWRPAAAIVSANTAGVEKLLAHLERRDVPIILIGDERQLHLPDEVRTLEAVLLTPAEPEEIAAAAQVVVGRVPLRDLPDHLDLGTLRLDVKHRRAYVDDRAVELPPREFVLLAELAINAERPISSAELARRVWPESAWTTADDVRRSVYRLRRLLGDHRRTPPLIRNRRGYGYVLEVSER